MTTKKKPAPLRDQILDFLRAHDEATLKQIAAATTERDYPSRVTTELNKLRTEAVVECEKKKGKNELWYWLAQATTQPQPAVGKNAGSSASVLPSTPAEGAAVQPEPAPEQPADVSQAAPVAEDEMQDGDEMPPADASLLALANRELSDRLARVAHVLRGSGLEGLKDLDDGADLQSAAAALTGAYQMALADLQARTDSLSAACSALGAIGDRLDVDSCTGGCGPILDAIDLKDQEVADLQHKINMQDAELFKVQHVLGQRIHIGDPGQLAAPVKCAELAAELIDSLLGTNQDNLNLIAIASEKLADVVETGGTDTSDMDLHEIAEQAAARIAAKDTELLEQARVVVALRDTITQRNAELSNAQALVEKLEHLLQSARNEAEHLRRHVTHNEDGLDGQPLGNLLMGAREFLEVGQRVTVTGGEAKVEVRALNITFDLAPHEVSEVLEHATALERKLPVPF